VIDMASSGGNCETCGKYRSLSILEKNPGGCFFHPGNAEKQEWSSVDGETGQPKQGAKRLKVWSCCGAVDKDFWMVKRRPEVSQGCEERDHVVPGVWGGSGNLVKAANKT
jgi:hypothetical protein